MFPCRNGNNYEGPVNDCCQGNRCEQVALALIQTNILVILGVGWE